MYILLLIIMIDRSSNSLLTSTVDATRSFLTSKTHEMLENAEYGLLSFPERAIFDMWEVEQVTGDPRNSAYVRGE